LADSNPECEVVGYVLGGRDVHSAPRFRYRKYNGAAPEPVPPMPTGFHVALSDWCAGCATGAES
jgi:hypothetical protein